MCDGGSINNGKTVEDSTQVMIGCRYGVSRYLDYVYFAIDSLRDCITYPPEQL